MLRIESHEQTQDTSALLKTLALGNRQIEEGRGESATEILQRLEGFRDNILK